MKYRIGTIPTFDRETMTEGTKPFRMNDGSLVVMAGDAGDEDAQRVLLVPRFAHVKRTASYDTPDPEQEAFARRVVDLLNGA
jgi:hypothetical protein